MIQCASSECQWTPKRRIKMTLPWQLVCIFLVHIKDVSRHKAGDLEFGRWGHIENNVPWVFNLLLVLLRFYNKCYIFLFGSFILWKILWNQGWWKTMCNCSKYTSKCISKYTLCPYAVTPQKQQYSKSNALTCLWENNTCCMCETTHPEGSSIASCSCCDSASFNLPKAYQMSIRHKHHCEM